MNPHALEVAFAEYAQALLDRYDIGEVLYRLTDQSLAVLDADGAGVSIAESADQLRFVTASDESSSRIERQQAATRSGPCHDAYRSGKPVSSADLERDDRWSGYRELALEEGFHAVLGIPMPVADEPIGALDVYRRRAGEWTPEEIERATLLANMAAGYVVLSRSLEESRTVSDQLQRALDSRIIVEQAKGIVAERHGVDLDRAFAMLRERSQRTNTPIHVVCAGVVRGELRL